jgi:hypothetical protein
MSLSAAVKQVSDEASALARLELELVRRELGRKAARFGKGAALLAAAAILGLFAVGFGLAAAAAGIAVVTPVWAALLIVFGAVVLVASVLGAVGVAVLKRGSPPVPEQAISEAKLTLTALQNGGGDRGDGAAH